MHTDNCSFTNSTVNASPAWGSTTLTTPGFAFPGGKRRLRNTIVNFMPKSGGTYAEPFVGKGNLFFKAAGTLKYSNWWLNDLRTSGFFRALISCGNTIEVPEHTREQFERYKVAHESGDTTASLFEPYFTYNGAGYRAGYRTAKGSPTQAGYERTLRSAHTLLVQTQAKITNFDWNFVHAELREGDFALYDPPYLGAKVHGYSPSDLDHREMIDALRQAPYRWILCEYMHEWYVEAFGPPFWSKDVQLCATNFRHDAGQARRVECLWRNF